MDAGWGRYTRVPQRRGGHEGELALLKLLLGLPLDDGSLADWNDDPRRTLGQVVAALRRLEGTVLPA